MKCLPREQLHTCQRMKYTGSLRVCLIITLCGFLWLFDKAPYFTLACLSVKCEQVELIDGRTGEMMHFPRDCFHCHYSRHTVISRQAADTSARARATEPSPRRVRLPLPQRGALIAGLNQCDK